MDRARLIIGLLALGFVIFVTARGELPDYLKVLTGQHL